MLDKLSALHSQDDDDDDDNDYGFTFEYSRCDVKSRYQKQERKEITQFYDNLCHFTPLLYQFTTPRYPKQQLGHCSCSKNYSQWHCQVFNIKNGSKLHELSSEKKL